MKVQLNIHELNSAASLQSEYPMTPEEAIELIPIGKSGIHIKKENRGSFTSYCGGKVTDACIRKAKNSPSAAIRKKAVFAENARGWARKHQEGGVLDHTPGLSQTGSDISKMFVNLDVDAPTFAVNNPQYFSGGFSNPIPKDLDIPEKETTETETTPAVQKPAWLTAPYEGSRRTQQYGGEAAPTTTSTRRTSSGPAAAGTFGQGVSAALRDSVNRFLGVPYQFGGGGPEHGQGLDCSGFVSRVLGNMGSSLHGNCRTLWNGTTRVDTQNLQPGDLVFLQDTQPGKVAHGKASHVGIVTDTSRLSEGIIGVAHSGGSGKKSNMVEWNLNNGYYGKHFLGAGRVVQNAKFGGTIDYTQAHE